MQRMCRICSDSESPKYDVFLTTLGNRSISYFITRYLYIKIEKEDKLPHQICSLCCEKIRHIHKYAQLAATMQEKFVLLAIEGSKKKPASLSDKGNRKKCVPSANKKNTVKSTPLTAGKKVNSPLKNAENIKYFSKTAYKVKETHEKKFLILCPGGKKQVTSVKVPKNLNVTNNSKNENIDERNQENKVTQTDNGTVKVAESTSSVNTLDKSTEENYNQKDVANENNDNIPAKSISDQNIIENCLPTHSRYLRHKYPPFNTNYTIQLSNSTHTNELYQCNICKKTFLYRYSLFRHMFSHSEIKRYTCNVCKMGFIEKWKCDQHFRQQHMGEIFYKCDICIKTFPRKENLKNHLTIHEGKKSYCCSLCNRAFGWKKTLKDHMSSIHEIAKVYTCDICNKDMAHKGSLQRHIYSHLKLFDKQFKCERCGESFHYNCELQRHFKTLRHRMNVDHNF